MIVYRSFILARQTRNDYELVRVNLVPKFWEIRFDSAGSIQQTMLMNQQLLSGLTATLVIATLGFPSSGCADATMASDTHSVQQAPEPKMANDESAQDLPHTQNTQAIQSASQTVSSLAPALETEPAASASSGDSRPSASYRSTIAEVQAHNFDGKQAATLYVRDIPVLTFLASRADGVPSLAIVNQNLQANETQVKEFLPPLPDNLVSFSHLQDDPVWQAVVVATRLNILSQSEIDPDSITVSWSQDLPKLEPAAADASDEEKSGSAPAAKLSTTRQKSSPEGYYIIKVDGEPFVIMDGRQIILPDTTRDSTQDALQATNRLRRLLGGAKPLTEIEGKPKLQTVAVGTGITMTGWASWYGPGFHGNRSANGEVFNQYALTAAHPNLPFGTRVRVTNLSTGQSVVVRINDRGPYAGDRIIDLSAAAAQQIGMYSSGVAQVMLEILK